MNGTMQETEANGVGPLAPAVEARLDRGVSRQPAALPVPYWQDDAVTLYHGDALALLPLLPKADAVVTDPPYGETSLDWDVWPTGWPAVAAHDRRAR